MTVKCQLCGRDIEYEYLSKKAQCGHCGINVFFDENGNTEQFSEKVIYPSEAESEAPAGDSDDHTNNPAEKPSDLNDSQNKAVFNTTDAPSRLNALLKRSFKPMIITMVCVSLLLAAIFVAVPQIKVIYAKSLISNGSYSKAYYTLMGAKHYPPAKKLLAKFEWKYTEHTLENSLYDTVNLTKYNYKYDEQGNLTSEEAYRNDSRLYIKEYTYSNGKLIRAFRPNNDTVAYYVTDIYLYDQNGNLIKLETVDEFGSSLGKKEYTYDDSGRMLSEVFFNYNSDHTNTTRTLNTYNGLGYLTLTEVYRNGKLQSYKKYTYNKRGDCTRIAGGVAGDGEKVLEETVYDSKGRPVEVITNPSSRAVTKYTYGKNGKLTYEKRYIGNVLVLTIKNTYYSNGKLKTKATGYADIGYTDYENYTYDKYGNLTSIEYKNTQLTDYKQIENYSGYVIFYTP